MRSVHTQIYILIFIFYLDVSNKDNTNQMANSLFPSIIMVSFFIILMVAYYMLVLTDGLRFSNFPLEGPKTCSFEPA